jgi:hypothetical protein
MKPPPAVSATAGRAQSEYGRFTHHLWPNIIKFGPFVCRTAGSDAN